jgi:hypothetical protein
MRLTNFSLVTLTMAGRRRLWWARRPLRPLAVSAVETNATPGAGQVFRPVTTSPAFSARPWPTLGSLGRLTRASAVVLTAGALLYLATSGRPRALLGAGAALPAGPGTGMAGAPLTPRGPAMGPSGLWHDLGGRTLPPLEGLGRALLGYGPAEDPSPRIEAGRPSVLGRVSRDWGLACRGYATTWATAHAEALRHAPTQPRALAVGGGAVAQRAFGGVAPRALAAPGLRGEAGQPRRGAKALRPLHAAACLAAAGHGPCVPHLQWRV